MRLSRNCRYSLILSCASGLGLAHAASSSGDMLVPGSGGADRLSIESAGPGGASRIARMVAGDCSLPTIWSNVDLGVPANGNVDAISFPFQTLGAGSGNTIPYRGPAIGGGLARGQVCVGSMTVDRNSPGPAGSVVNEEFLGNGAASDTFLVRPFGGTGSAPKPVLKNSDGDPCLTVKGSGLIETDIDSITGYFGNHPVYPVFYSVDSATIMSLPLGGVGGPVVTVSPADILVAESSGVAFIAVTAMEMGLIPGDDIDALSVCFDLEHAVYSLTAPSPSAQATYPVIGQLGGAGLFSYYVGYPVVVPWATPSQVGLRAPLGAFGTFNYVPGDELNGIRIGDPRAGCYHH